MHKYARFLAGGTVIGAAIWGERKFVNRYREKTYTLDQVSKHDRPDDLWVSYGDSVYDVTKFHQKHPGGSDKILMAAGDRLEPYWNVYQIHKTDRVHEILKSYRIGKLDSKDVYSDKDDNPYQNESQRFVPETIEIHKQKPFNSEVKYLSDLREKWITPVTLWYVRNHHPVPKIDPKTFSLMVCNKDECSNHTLEQLKNLPQKEVTTTIQCAGNRRKDFKKDTLGLKWKGGAMGNAIWTGVGLSEFLKMMGVTEKDGSYVHFTGEDLPFDTSISLKHALDPENDVLLAYKMNHQELTPDHGFPLRVIVPGMIGAKQVKWLTGIKVSDEESYSTWQRGIAYKKLPSSVRKVEDVTDFMIKSISTTEETPVQSLVMDFKDGKILGAAYSGGGRKIEKVEVSYDQKTWFPARITEGSDSNMRWSWVFWEVDHDKENYSKKVYCRATDSSGYIQPEEADWNLRGILNNGYSSKELTNASNDSPA